jgi:hypothetical protein
MLLLLERVRSEGKIFAMNNLAHNLVVYLVSDRRLAHNLAIGLVSDRRLAHNLAIGLVNDLMRRLAPKELATKEFALNRRTRTA